MVAVLIDSNIVIDLLRGVPQALTELRAHDDVAISLVTWIEVMAGATTETEPAIRRYLGSLRHYVVDMAIGEKAVLLRRTHRIRLPDALIWATAQVHGRLLVTRNTRHFPADNPDIRIPYRL